MVITISNVVTAEHFLLFCSQLDWIWFGLNGFISFIIVEIKKVTPLEHVSKAVHHHAKMTARHKEKPSKREVGGTSRISSHLIKTPSLWGKSHHVRLAPPEFSSSTPSKSPNFVRKWVTFHHGQHRTTQDNNAEQCRMKTASDEHHNKRFSSILVMKTLSLGRGLNDP